MVSDEMPFTVTIADIDNFKSINNIFGRDIGDQVIQKTVSLLRSNISQADLITRHGDEFTMLLLDKGAERSLMYIAEISTHLEEFFTLFIATILNWNILYPIHLLWVNLIIDTLPALAHGHLL
ncbi:MAG: diguanylate cyclase [Mobilitalea sp.]